MPNATEVEFGVKITVIGLGYVGTVAAACLSDAGHDVTGVDIDSDRIGTLQAGRVLFFEPGLEELLQASLVLQSHLNRECLKASLVMGLQGSGLMPASPP